MDLNILPIKFEGSELELVSMDNADALKSSTVALDLLAKNNLQVRRFSTRNCKPVKSSTAEKDNEDNKSAGGKLVLSTRSKNGCKNTDEANQDADQDENDNILTDQCAIALASLDHRAYARLQMRDANIVMEQLLLPISFPWSQNKEILYKPLPRDIDDMSIIMQADEDCSISELNDETYRLMKSAEIPNEIPIATTRTEDPGVVELRTYVKPAASVSKRLRKMHSLRFQDDQDEDPSIDGEISLRMYNQVQLKKRVREEYDIATSHKKYISFRVGSTSSRLSIFSASEISNSPLFLYATYPKQIQDGVKRFGLEGYEEGIKLGSYNCRSLPDKDAVMNDATSKNRFAVGRTRIIWSEKEQVGSKSQRAVYRSILSGQRLESNGLKRPLSVKVGIRINGALLSSRQYHQKDQCTEPSYTYSLKIVQDAIDHACNVAVDEETTVAKKSNVSPIDYSQCYINTSKFVEAVSLVNRGCVQNQPQLFRNEVENIRRPIGIQRRLSIYKSTVNGGATVQNYIYRIHLKDEISGTLANMVWNGKSYVFAKEITFKANVVPPRLDCLPTEDGLMQVTCTSPGKIILSFDDVINEDLAPMAEYKRNNGSDDFLSPSLLLNVLASELRRCAACWKHRDEVDKICIHCTYSHGTCFQTKNDDIVRESAWIHTMGKPWSDLDALTPLESYRSMLGIERATDANANIPVPWYQNKACCHICTNGTVGCVSVVCCAAEGCNVRFHPMCAIIVSAANEMRYRKNHSVNNISNGRNNNSSSNHESTDSIYYEYENDDTYLCTQYTQIVTQTSFERESLMGKSVVDVCSQHEYGTGIWNCESGTGRCAAPSTTLHSNSTRSSNTATKRKKKHHEVILPIMFCPYHNPKRCDDFYGFYPNGCNFSHDTIRIPPQRQWG